MRGDGYKAIMVKEAVGDMFRAAAKAEGKTLSSFLEALIHGYNKRTGLCDTCNKELKEVRQLVEKVGEDIKMVREVMEGYRR